MTPQIYVITRALSPVVEADGNGYYFFINGTNQPDLATPAFEQGYVVTRKYVSDIRRIYGKDSVVQCDAPLPRWAR